MGIWVWIIELSIWLTVWAPSMQWAAVITWFSFIIEPPQKCRPRFFNVTCHGNSSVTIWKAAILKCFLKFLPLTSISTFALKWNFNFFWEFQLESYSFCQIAKMSVNQNASSYDFFFCNFKEIKFVFPKITKIIIQTYQSWKSFNSYFALGGF